jgi:hypothetical protein
MHLNMSYLEVKQLPIRYRRWFLDRIVKHFKEQNERLNKDKNNRNESDDLASLADFEKQVNSKFT